MCKFLFIALAAAMSVILFSSCDKEKDPPAPPEDQLKITIDAPAFNIVPGSGTNFNVSVESVMPPSGVKVTAVVKGEINNVVYHTPPVIETSNKITKVYISNLPQQIVCICTITVASKSTPMNFATTSFRVVYK